jgi:acetyl-CoA C-acetyltransferase
MKTFHNKEKGIGILFDDIYIVNGARTAFGKYCGTLAQVSPTDLAIYASRAAMEKSGIKPGEIDQVIAANIGQSSGDAYFYPRHLALYSGIPEEIPSLMVQRICASGFETIITGAEQIVLGKADVTLCTGAETMSLAPTVGFGNRMGYPLGRPVFKDMLWEALDDTACGYPMGYTAENVAIKHNITREDCDAFAMQSFERALAAVEKGFFKDEIVAISPATFTAGELKPRKVKFGKNGIDFSTDEHVRPTSLEALAKLPTVFSEVGVLTAGNCSGIVDGAASVVVASKKYILDNQLKTLSRVAGAASCGIDPRYMGLGPVPAIRLLLEMTGLKIEDIGLIEINEAFSAQFIGCEKELGFDRANANVNGGAIAIGHPLAATGGRLSLTISHEMNRRKVKYGIASACIGGGQGTAVLYENSNM